MYPHTKPRVAYFCMEFGLDPELPVYAGGLGILAGDAMKSIGDLSLPVTGSDRSRSATSTRRARRSSCSTSR